MAPPEASRTESHADPEAQDEDEYETVRRRFSEIMGEDSDSHEYFDEPQKPRYHWPDLQTNIWILILSAAATGTIGIFATLIRAQIKMGLEVPWYMTLGVASGSLSVIDVVSFLILAQRRLLLPIIIILSSILLAPMWITGVVATSIALWGTQDGVNARCNKDLQELSTGGHDIYTLLWLQESSICERWVAVFSIQLVGFLFSLWMLTISLSVYKASHKTSFWRDLWHGACHDAISIWHKLKASLAKFGGEKSENQVTD